ncbi:Transducin family protein [Dorcoceras hygrometricum]|uniref:Transducin family protein n=1 Tax=Dorcoceras hygrometricum TaxID=472368 RepID=A0A2Z7B9N6_9LAMI|nr:Transducin family protein [Dorcoceras hygrometricum]
MVKSYLRYEAAASFGVIVSVDCNITYDSFGKHLLVGALEKLGVWNVRQGVCSKFLAPTPSSSSRGRSLAVTSIAASSSPSLIASGYADGSIRIWDSEKETCETTLNGHKKAVTVLRYNKMGSLLASGSKDNDIILWDVVAEAGLFRLCGHRDQVTDLVFLDASKKLVSSSKDKFLRVWDLETQHCTQIVSGHHSEIWSIDVDPTETYLVSGSADPELRFFTVKKDFDKKDTGSDNMEYGLDNAKKNTPNKWDVLKPFGEVLRQNKDRVATVRFNKFGNMLACQVSGTMVELFRVLGDSESRRKAKRRINRKEKKSSEGKSESAENGNSVAEEASEILVTAPDVFKLLQTVRAGKKTSMATTKTSVIELQGHRSDVRSVTLSSDNTLLMSTSHSAIKIWNPSTGSCLRTIDSGYGICGLFVPGNKYAIIGTKSGMLEIIDVRSGSCLEVVEAHGGPVNSIVPTADGFVTGSADHDVKFWEYQTVTKPGQDSKQLAVSPVRNLNMGDEVVVIAVSPEGKHIAVALLNFKVKRISNLLQLGTVFNDRNVFFLDSLKLFLPLYGHNSLVLCMDISSDGDLIVTGSSNKDLKVWGLDFGNIRSSTYAHEDSVMAVKFVKNTHYVFSVGKDSLVKYWDADKLELLLSLEGHHSAIWCLAISNRGDFVVTGSHDRSIRRWDRTEEPFFIEEEKEKRFEEMLESEREKSYAPTEEPPEEGSVVSVGKRTGETVTAVDSMLEALDIAEEELKRISDYEDEKSQGKLSDFRPNILMLGLSPSEYVLRAVSSVHTNDLEQAFLALPFVDSLRILSYLKDWVNIPDKVELVCRVATMILQIHHNQLVATVSARPVLSILKGILHKRIKECKDTLGFNLAAMEHLKHMMATKSDAPFRDAKTKLLEIRSQYLKRAESSGQTKEERRRKKKKKKMDSDHVWS